MIFQTQLHKHQGNQQRLGLLTPQKLLRITRPARHVLRTKATATNDASTSILNSIRKALNLTTPAAKQVNEHYRLFLDSWDKGFMECDEDPEGYWLECVYGNIPRELTGTLFRNGPGRFSVKGEKIGHPYDGDGLVASISFKDGAAYFRSRFVQTAEFLAESHPTNSQGVLFRGTFATQRQGGSANNAFDLHVKNTSNTNVVCHAGRVWSLFEAGQPYKLDPYTLETQGIEDLGGRLRKGMPLNLGTKESNDFIGRMTQFVQTRSHKNNTTGSNTSSSNNGTATSSSSGTTMPEELLRAGGDAMTAHPHLDPISGRLVTFTYTTKPILPKSIDSPIVGTDIKFWELDEGMEPVVMTEFSIPGFAFVHDFAMTENYYILFQNPVTVDNAPYILGKAPAASCVRWLENTPTLVHLIPRPKPQQQPSSSSSTTTTTTATTTTNNNTTTNTTNDTTTTTSTKNNKKPMTFVAPPLFVFHHANAFESEDGNRVIIDSIHYNSFPAVGREALAEQKVDPDAAFSSRLKRVDIDLTTHVMRIQSAFNGYLEMPSISPKVFSRRHQFVYGYNSLFADPQIAIAKVDLDTKEVENWVPGVNRFALEPKFIPRHRKHSTTHNNNNNNTTTTATTATTSSTTNNSEEEEREDDGWLICQLFDVSTPTTIKSEIVILDALNLAKGPVAVLQLKKPLASALHSSWSDVYYGVESPPKGEANVIPFGGSTGSGSIESVDGDGGVVEEEKNNLNTV